MHDYDDSCGARTSFLAKYPASVHLGEAEPPLTAVSNHGHRGNFTVMTEGVNSRSRAAFGQGTAIGHEWYKVEASESDIHAMEVPKSAPIDIVSQTRDNRLALMAAKFEGTASVEDAARIHLLTARLRRIAPRVSDAEKDGVEKVMKSLEDADSLLGQISSKFGLQSV